jgi:hypothetical protein
MDWLELRWRRYLIVGLDDRDGSAARRVVMAPSIRMASMLAQHHGIRVASIRCVDWRWRPLRAAADGLRLLGRSWCGRP